MRALHQELRAGKLLFLGLFLTGFFLTLPVQGVQASDRVLHLTGMTYAASQGERTDFLLEARQMKFMPDLGTSLLQEVEIRMFTPEGRVHLFMTCDQGEFDVGNHDFYAEGHVRGRTKDGKQFATEWVRYHRETGVLTSDAPVRLLEEGREIHAGGFRYDVESERLQLVGGMRFEQ